MNGLCACCGTDGESQEHHVGGRARSEFTVRVCPLCHNLLTIADVYERKWNPAAQSIVRIATGFVDLAAVLAANVGCAEGMQLAASYSDRILPAMGMAELRVSSAIPDYPGSSDPDTAIQILSVALYKWCVFFLFWLMRSR